MKYIECKHTALVKCRLADGQTVDFYPRIINKYTGLLAHTGFTQVSEDLLIRLEEESKVFKGFIKQKLLFIRDTLPASAQTAAEMLSAKDVEIAKLKLEIAELKEAADKQRASAVKVEEPTAITESVDTTDKKQKNKASV